MPLTGSTVSLPVRLPFPFPFYGQSYSTAHVTTNGFLNFLAPSTLASNVSIPSPAAPNAAIYPMWDDLDVNSAASVRTELLGSAPNRRFVIEWRNVRFGTDSTRRVDFEVVLHENGHILTQYRNLANDNRERGSQATVGIENESGTIALRYSFNQPAIEHPSSAILYRLPPSAFVEGTVTDGNDGQPIEGATVHAVQDRIAVRQVTTDASGHYRLHVPLGTYNVEVSSPNYTTETIDVAVDVEDRDSPPRRRPGDPAATSRRPRCSSSSHRTRPGRRRSRSPTPDRSTWGGRSGRPSEDWTRPPRRAA